MAPLCRGCCAALCLPVAVVVAAVLWAHIRAPRSPFPFHATQSAAPEARPVAIVTGANTGIGYETAAELVARGYTVVVACRSSAKGSDAAASINAATATRNNANFSLPAQFMQLDLASMASVASFAAGFRARFGALHALVLNAGMNVKIGETAAERTTVDGFEICMQSNYLGHFALADMLLPLMLETAAAGAGAVPVRVVALGSIVHRLVTAQQCADWPRTFKAIGAYNYDVSKFAMVSLARHLNRLLQAAAPESGGGVRALSVNPGAVLSDVWRHWPDAARRAAFPVMSALFLSTAQGAAPAVAAASQWRLEGAAGTGHNHNDSDSGFDGAAVSAVVVELIGGEYLVPYHVVTHAEPVATLLELVGPFAGVQRAQPQVLVEDESLAWNLWDASIAATSAAADMFKEACCPQAEPDAVCPTATLFRDLAGVIHRDIK